MFPSPHDPFRTPDFRWQRACWLLEQGKYARRGRDDDYTLLAKKFKSAMDRAKDDIDLAQLAQRFPGLYYAYLLYRTDDQDDRWTIEARLLAGQDLHTIAERACTSTEVIFWYEALFFNVSDKLHRKDWLANRVLGPAAHRGIRERDYDLLLKLYALVGGPVVVDVLVEMNARTSSHPMGRGEINAFWQGEASDELKKKAALAVRCMPINPNTASLILEAHHKLMELEKDNNPAGDQATLILNNINATLQAVPFHTVRINTDKPALRLHTGTAVEKRASELFASGVGVNLPLDDMMSDFRIPEAPDAAGTS